MIRRRFMRYLLLFCALAGVSLGEEVGPFDEIERRLGPATECGRDSTFKAYVLVEHEMMDDPNMLNITELNRLANAFKTNYNVLNAPQGGKNTACDVAHLRYANTPIIIPKEVFYEDLPEGGYPARRNFLYVLTVNGVSVTDETRLFEFGTEERRDLFTVPDEILETAKSELCKCADNLEQRAPTEEEVTKLFNKTIKKQKARGNLVNIGRAVHVTELEIVDCKPQLFDFETEVVVEFGGPAAQEELDIGKLENDFMDSYNDLSSFFCDPCFRVITSVQVEESEIQEESTRQLNKKRRKRLVNRVKTRCRKKTKCKRQRKLFDDAAQRARGLEPLVPVNVPNERHRRRRVEGKNVCYCPTQPAADRAPNTDEFARAYNSITKRTSDVVVKEVTE